MEEFKASVFRKVTIRLIPFLILAYLLNYIDRVNLGFAALQMNRDLGLTATTFWLWCRDSLYRLFPFWCPQ